MTFTKRAVARKVAAFVTEGLAITTFVVWAITLVPQTVCAAGNAQGKAVPAAAAPVRDLSAETAHTATSDSGGQRIVPTNASPTSTERNDADARGGVASSSTEKGSLLPIGDAAAERHPPRMPDVSAIIPQSDRPWETGVTARQKKTARQLLGEGNDFWSQARFSEAAEKFTQALEHWDHPKIHYNLALALVALDRPLESREHLLAAMRYGDRALSAKELERAKFHLQDVAKRRLAAIDVRCDIPGADIRIDGQSAFVAPIHHHTVVLPGLHAITASKPGYVGTEHSAMLSPGLVWVIQPKVYANAELTRHRRRWPSLRAEPSILMGAGAALLALGVVFTVSANAAVEDINERCRNRNPCEFSGELYDLDSRADQLRAIAGFSYVTGGTVFITGLVLSLLNMERPYLITPPKGHPNFVPMSPLAGVRALGVAGGGRF